MTSYRPFPLLLGPSQGASYTGPIVPGVGFEVTTSGTWFEGYWWWVCRKGQAISPQRFAPWQVYADGTGTLT